jgi:hypothetical protein
MISCGRVTTRPQQTVFPRMLQGRLVAAPFLETQILESRLYLIVETPNVEISGHQ